jgi:hypothetical protein
MGFEPMNNGFAGRRVSHFATRAYLVFASVNYAQMQKTHCHLAVGFDKPKTSRLTPDARSNAQIAAHTTHAGATGVHWHHKAHGSYTS